MEIALGLGLAETQACQLSGFRGVVEGIGLNPKP